MVYYSIAGFSTVIINIQTPHNVEVKPEEETQYTVMRSHVVVSI